MAQTVYQNPLYFSGPALSLKKLPAANGQTWQAGQFGRMTDSGLVKCLSNATSIAGQFAQNQAVATSSSEVWFNAIESAQTKFIIGVTTGGNDAKAGLVLLGSNEGLGVNSSICTMSLGSDSNEIFHVHDVMGRVEPYKNDTSDSPGFAIVSVVASALTAEGAGL